MAITAPLTFSPKPRASDGWDGLFDGPFRHMAGALSCASISPAGPLHADQLAAPDGTLRADELAAAPRLGRALLDYQQQYPGADPRAVASMWTQWYFALLAAPLTLIGLRQGRLPPVALHEVAVRLDKGRPAGMVLLNAAAGAEGLGVEVRGAAATPAAVDADPASASAVIADPFQRFAPLIDDHLAPIIHALRGVSSVSERLLWNNAAVQVEWVLRTAGSLTTAVSGDDNLINQPCRPDGSANPLYRPLRPAPAGVTPVRRVCCLRYLLPGEPYCAGACPLPIAKECP